MLLYLVPSRTQCLCLSAVILWPQYSTLVVFLIRALAGRLQAGFREAEGL